MTNIFFPMSISFMSDVNFKKWLCRPVEFKGQEPFILASSAYGSSIWDLPFSAYAPRVVGCGVRITCKKGLGGSR